MGNYSWTMDTVVASCSWTMDRAGQAVAALSNYQVPKSAMPLVLLTLILTFRELQKRVEWFSSVEPSYLLSGFLICWFLARVWLKSIAAAPLKEKPGLAYQQNKAE